MKLLWKQAVATNHLDMSGKLSRPGVLNFIHANTMVILQNAIKYARAHVKLQVEKAAMIALMATRLVIHLAVKVRDYYSQVGRAHVLKMSMVKSKLAKLIKLHNKLRTNKKSCNSAFGFSPTVSKIQFMIRLEKPSFDYYQICLEDACAVFQFFILHVYPIMCCTRRHLESITTCSAWLSLNFDFKYPNN